MSPAIQQMLILLVAMGATGAVGYLVARETLKPAGTPSNATDELRRLKRKVKKAEADCAKLRSDLSRVKRAAR